MDKHRVIQRQFQLEENVQTIMTPVQQREYEKILQLRNEGLNYAEKRCRKIRCGQVPYSPELQKARIEIELWSAAKTIHTGRKYSSRKFRRLETKTGIFETLKKNKDALESGVQCAYQNYWKLKNMAERLRTSFLETKAESIAEESNLTSDNVIRQLIQRERERKNNRQIKFVLKKLKNNTIITIELQQEDGNTIELTDQQDIESACIQENMRKYS